MEKVYTIGYTESYDENLTLIYDLEKLGKDDSGYDGGIVWKTAQEARDFLDSGRKFGLLKFADMKSYSVYELELKNNWKNDVYYWEIDKVHLLINNAKIVKKVDI